MPTIERICKKFILFVQENAIKFHGNPPKIKLLINSIKEKKNEKISTEENFLSKEKKEDKNVATP